LSDHDLVQPLGGGFNLLDPSKENHNPDGRLSTGFAKLINPKQNQLLSVARTLADEIDADLVTAPGSYKVKAK
jgi:hypothetical protein